MGIRTKVEIDASALGIAWQKNTSYRFEVQADFVHEDGGDQQPCPAIPDLLSFTTNATGPVLVDTTPTSGTSNIENYTKVTLNFDRKVIKNTGSIKFYKTTGAVLIQTLNVAETDVYLEGSGYSVSFNLVGALQLASTSYYFTVDADAFRDYDGFDCPAVGSGIITFSTGTAPVLVSSSPTDNASNVNPTALTLTFDKNMKKGAGNIDIYTSADDELYYRINVTDSRVTISSSVVTINTTFILDSDTAYYIKIGSTAFTSSSGLPYAGISSTTALNFTTATGGVATALQDWRIYVNNYAIITFPNTTTPIASTDNRTNRTKGIKLWLVGSSNTLIHTFYDGVDADLTGNGITINCVPYIDYENEYFFTIDEGAYYNSATNLFIPGVNTKTTVLTFNTEHGFNGIETITYAGNTVYSFGSTLPNYYPKILNSSNTYTYELTSANGLFGLGTAAAVSTLTLTGTRNAIATSVNSNSIKFYPTKNFATSGTYTVTLKQGATVIGSSTYSLAYSGTTRTTADLVTFYSAGTGTWTPTFEQLRYFPNATVLLVGAGGNATYNNSTRNYVGGGGGGVLEQSGITITNTGYGYTVGNTTDTTMFSLTAYAGSNGTSGAPTTHTAGSGSQIINGNASTGGSGGGAGQNGWAMGASTTGYPTNATTAAFGGNIEAYGIDSTILGALGASKLGAGGSWNLDEASTWSYPRDAGHGACGAVDNSNPKSYPAHGIIVIKLIS